MSARAGSDELDMGGPEAEKFRRAGLTQAESERLARTLETREKTRAFWRSSPIGMLFWLIWKLIFKGFQPGWMLASFAGAAAFALLILQDLGGLGAVATAPPDLRQRIEQAFEGPRGPRDDVYGIWVDALTASLDGDLRRRPDLDRLRIWAEAGPYFIGRERLALELLAAGRSPGAVDAELRALPPQVRQERLSRALAGPLATARARNLDPAELIYAPESIRLRYAAAQPGWALVAEPVEGFLQGTREGRLDVRSLPGLTRRQAGDVYIHDGVRNLVIQLCLAPGAGDTLASRCGDDIPRQVFDPFLLGLAAWEAGMLDRQTRSVGAAQGARLLRAAYAAGRLAPELEAELRALFERELPPARIIEAAIAAGLDPAEAFQVPGRYRGRLAGSLAPGGEGALVALAAQLQSLYEIQGATSPSLTVRLAGTLHTLADAPRLQLLVNEMGSGVAILHETAGQAMFELIEIEMVEAQIQPRHLQGLALTVLSAVIVLLLSLRRIATPVMIRRASRLQAVDAYFCRLFLGKKA